MRLYLSSYRIPNPPALEKLLGRPLEDARVAVICNAKDTTPAREARKKITAFSQYLEELGFERPALVDLRRYSTAQHVETVLQNYDLIWAMGGNTFDLREAMLRCHFDTALRHLLKKGKVYGGDSAGAIVLGPSLAGFETMDEFRADHTQNFDGLEIIDRVIVPHNDSPDVRFRHRSPDIQRANPYHELVVLDDDKAYVVDGTTAMIL